MALRRIDEKTIVQKVKNLIIGNQRPKWFIRFSVITAFTIWLYFIIWQAFIFLTILFVNRLESPDLIKQTYARIGGQYNFNIDYAQMNWKTIDVVFFHSIGLFILFLISLIGLINIYKSKKIGYILYLLGNLGVIIFSILFLGLNYIKDQITLVDQSIFISISVIFLLLLFIFKPKTSESSNLQS